MTQQQVIANNQSRLLMQQMYTLCESPEATLTVGINAVNLETVVKLKSAQNSVTFTALEWSDFIKHIKNIVNSSANNVQQSEFHTYRVEYKVYVKWLQSEISLDVVSVDMICKICDFVSGFIDYLKSTKFEEYYRDINTEASLTPGYSLDNVRRLVSKDNNIQATIYKEMLTYYPHFIESDLITNMYYVPSNYDKFKYLLDGGCDSSKST